MASHRRTDLTLKQRYEIATLLANKIPQKEIARQVGTSESAIGRHSASNEKKRNQSKAGLYDADTANTFAIQRRKDKKQYKFNEKIKFSIEKLLGGTPLKEQYSPEQIVGALKKENEATMSPEYIYQLLKPNYCEKSMQAYCQRYKNDMLFCLKNAKKKL